MKIVLLPFLATLLLMMATMPAYGQGISAILERLDALESQIDEMGSAMEQINGSDQAVATQDFSAYDKSLADLATQLSALKVEFVGLSGAAPVTGPDPELVGRIALLEQKNEDLTPVLAELQAKQAAQAEADISAPIPAPAPAVEVLPVNSEFLTSVVQHPDPVPL